VVAHEELTGAPILDSYARDSSLAEWDERSFTVCLTPIPATQLYPRRHNMSVLQYEIVAVNEYRYVAYVTKQGQAIRLGLGQNYDEDEMVHIPTKDIKTFTDQMGIQQWGYVKLDCPEAPKILATWPGPLAQQIWAPGDIEESTLRHLAQWYRQSFDHPGLFVLA
jgi:hypothetical protein